MEKTFKTGFTSEIVKVGECELCVETRVTDITNDVLNISYSKHCACRKFQLQRDYYRNNTVTKR